MDWGRALVEHGAVLALGLFVLGSWLLGRFIILRPWKHRPSLRNASVGVLGLALVVVAAISLGPLWEVRSEMVLGYGLIDKARGTPAPELAFTEYPSGEQRSLSDFQGSLVILNFWADWCAPCGPELAALNRLQAEFGADGLQVVAVTRGSADRVADYFRDRPFDLVKGVLASRNSLAPLWALQDQGLPISFIIAGDGTVLEGHIGSRSEGFFRSRITSHLES